MLEFRVIFRYNHLRDMQSVIIAYREGEKDYVKSYHDSG